MSNNNMGSRQVLRSQQEQGTSGDERVTSSTAPTGSHPASRIPIPQSSNPPTVPNPLTRRLPGSFLPLPVAGRFIDPASDFTRGLVGTTNTNTTTTNNNIYDQNTGSFPVPGGPSSSSLPRFSNPGRVPPVPALSTRPPWNYNNQATHGPGYGNNRPSGQAFQVPQTTRLQSGRTTEAITSTRSTGPGQSSRKRPAPGAAAPPPPAPPAPRPAPPTSATPAVQRAPTVPRAQAPAPSSGRVRYGYPYPRKTDEQVAQEIAEAEARVTTSTGRQRANEPDRAYLKRLKSNIGCARRKRTVRNSQTRRLTRGQQNQPPLRPQGRQNEQELEAMDEEEEEEDQEAEPERPAKRPRTAAAGDDFSTRRVPAVPFPTPAGQAPHPYLQSYGQPFGQARPGPVNYPALRPAPTPQVVTGTPLTHLGIPVSLEEYRRMAETIQRQQQQINQLQQERNAAVDQVSGIARHLGVPSGEAVYDARSGTFHAGFLQISGFIQTEDRAVAYPQPPPEPEIEQLPEDEPRRQDEQTLPTQHSVMEPLTDDDADGEEFSEDEYSGWTGA